MRKLLIALVVLVAALVAADRIAVAVAENQVSSRVQTAYGLPARPDVSITGFPFLTQAISGTYQQVDVSAAAAQADGVTLRQLRVIFHGVRAPLAEVLGHGVANVTAASASGTALIGYADVRRLLPAGVTLAVRGSRLEVSGHVVLQGVRTPVTADVALAVTPAGIRVTPTAVVLASGISVPIGVLGTSFAFVVPVSSLPLHLTLTSVTVTPSGLQVGATARNLHFARA